MRSPSLTLTTSLVALSLTVGLAGCSSTSGKKSSGGGSGSAAATPAARLASAKKVLDSTSGVHLKLSSNDYPKNANGIVSGEGDGSHAPSFKGTLNGQISGISASIPIIAVDNKVWAKLPIWPKMKEINPADYSAPDPAKLFATSGGVSDLLTKTKNPTFGSEIRSGSDVVKEIKGKLSGTDVVSTFVIGDKSQQYDVTYQLTDDNRVVNVQLDGVFAGGAKSTYELALSKYGQKVDVKAP